jgi:hypothetical protein
VLVFELVEFVLLLSGATMGGKGSTYTVSGLTTVGSIGFSEGLLSTMVGAITGFVTGSELLSTVGTSLGELELD